jgi:hypothetical protein
MLAFFSTASRPLALPGKKTRICGYGQQAHAILYRSIHFEKINPVLLTKEFLERGQEVSQPLAIQTAGLSLMLGNCSQ